MKKDIYQMSALNDKQMWLCDIMTRLPLIKYVDYLEDGNVMGHLLDSPITGKPLSIWWRVESHPFIHWLFNIIWRSRICWDKEAERRLEELKRLSWIHFDGDEPTS